MKQDHRVIYTESTRITPTQIILSELLAVFKAVSDLLTGKIVRLLPGSEIDLFIDNKAVLSLVSKVRASYFKELESAFLTSDSRLLDSLNGFLFSALLLFSVARSRFFVRANYIRSADNPADRFSRTVLETNHSQESFFPGHDQGFSTDSSGLHGSPIASSWL